MSDTGVWTGLCWGQPQPCSVLHRQRHGLEREGGEGGDMSRVTLGGVVETGQGPWLLSSHPDPSVLSSLPPATHTPPPAPRRAALFLGLGSRERRTQLSREIC